MKPAAAAPSRLHPRNQHHGRYDFAKLIETTPELARFVVDNTINFADAAAVKALNKALLLSCYQIRQWDIPAGFLCPPIPGRVDYLHYLADLIGPNAKRVLDVGVGANGVYTLLGARIYGWQMVGSDINQQALKHLSRIVAANPDLAIELRQQHQPKHVFNGIIQTSERFDATLCNPPFHRSLAEAQQGTQRKWKNLGKRPAPTQALNFGGQGAELWCPGGEMAFIKTQIEESQRFAQQCRWFTSLVSKAEHLTALQHQLRHAKVRRSEVISMAQGQKQSRILAWSFMA